MTIVLIIITIIYVILIALFSIGFTRVPEFKNDKTLPKTRFSIIIPFRNEAENLPNLLNSITLLTYPKHLFEVILINDNSTDNSITCINKFKTKYPDIPIITADNNTQTNSPKKDAITLGIRLAKNEWILTTDSDCIVPRYWLTTYNAFITNSNAVFISGAVTYRNANSFFEQFQLLDFLSLIGTTIGCFGINKPFLCNGANLAYKKSVFIRINGFVGNTNIASGDDVFLLEKVKQHFPYETYYLKSKNALVTTMPESTFKQLIQQRKRWAAKASHYNNNFSKLVGITILSINAILLIAPFVILLNPKYLILFICCFTSKIVMDFILLYQTSKLFNQQYALKSFPLSSLLYPIFSIYIVFSSQILGYKWKSRTFKK